MTASNIALELSIKEKRLKYWRDRFQNKNTSYELQLEVEELLNTYCLLISKLANAENEEQLSQDKMRITALETKLTSLYEKRRLATSELGTPTHG